jgi:transcription elongation factor GreB
MTDYPPDLDDEEDDEDQGPLKGRKNYITRQGFDALQAELRELARVERPKVVEIVSWAAGNGDRSENGDYLYGFYPRQLSNFGSFIKALRVYP